MAIDLCRAVYTGVSLPTTSVTKARGRRCRSVGAVVSARGCTVGTGGDGVPGPGDVAA